MEKAVSREPYNFDKDFKGLPVKNRMKLIKTAKNLLAVQRTSRDNDLLLADAPVSPNEMGKQGLA